MRLEGFNQAALGKTAPRDVTRPILPEVSSPSVQFSAMFDFQSYYDSTLLEKAILEQPRNSPIVDSTVQIAQVTGYSLGLAPWSQTPIAVEFLVNGQSGSSVLVCRPGQVIKPMGGKSFSGIRWGLPFGWLGGGMATVFIFTTEKSTVHWGAASEVIFHRVRVPILQVADLTSGGSNNNARKNWPMRFPWTQALSGSSSISQKADPVLAITQPTRVALALRGFSTLPGSAGMRIIYQATNDFGLDSAGDIVLTNPVYQDVTWPAFSSVGTSGNLATQNPVIELVNNSLANPLTRLAADDGGIALVDLDSVGAPLTSGFVDFCRYGIL